VAVDLAFIRAVEDFDSLVRLLNHLGYREPARPVDVGSWGLDEYPRNRVMRLGRRKREGYALFLAEMDAVPTRLRYLGQQLLTYLHDRPLAILGIRGTSERWERLVLVRPRRIRSAKGMTYQFARFEIELHTPTRHAAEVLDRMRWQSDADDPQAAIDDAFNVEAVTRAFFKGLKGHFDALTEALKRLSTDTPAVGLAIHDAGGPERVAIRILSQLLFSWFLQHQGLLAGDRQYFVHQWRTRSGLYYSTVLEPLFYETLALPVEQRPPGRPGPEIPFLNGGLFTRTYGSISLPLPDALFHPDTGILGYFSRWTFTISEETPDAVDVAVDPELLGRIFEHLISDEEEQRHGVVYTPRPVVQFMCREALVGWLEAQGETAEDWARLLVTDDTVFHQYLQAYGPDALATWLQRLETALDTLTVLDPAVGSGAFLLGMLAELIRIRQLIYTARTGSAPSQAMVHAWKLYIIEHTLFGVDIEPMAVELCRLRLWLSLLADIAPLSEIAPLPNLEYRTIAADSLTDFAGGVAVQDTRHGVNLDPYYHFTEDIQVIAPERHAYFMTSDPHEKQVLRQTLDAEENALIDKWLTNAEQQVETGSKSAAHRAHIAALLQAFHSRDRVFPVFIPAFHAPEVVARGGWDIVVMNPPYLGKKQVAQKIDPVRQADYEAHHGEKNDLMILFAYRARQLVRPGGVCAMIVQDSVFTSTDGTRLRERLLTQDTLRVVARTRCFEDRAINGAVLVWFRSDPPENGEIRYIEGYGHDPRDLAAASGPVATAGAMPILIGDTATELFLVPRQLYRIIPSQPLFRPDTVAQEVLMHFEHLQPADVRTVAGWARLSNTRALTRLLDQYRQTGWFDRLTPGTWVPLGYCIVGGQGLATADDRHFLGAIAGTPEAAECAAHQERLIGTFMRYPDLAERWVALQREYPSVDEALIAFWDRWGDKDSRVKWPRILRVVPPDQVRRSPLTADELTHGIVAGPHFVPFEKGDQSADGEGVGGGGGARWWRDNPIVIDWSRAAVALLRQRARGATSHKKPRFQNEHLQGQSGVTWNRIARYFRVRLVPEGGIFGDKAPLAKSLVSWLDSYSLMALLNSDVIDWMVRTYLGSLMQIEIGDIRRLPVPVLTAEQAAWLSAHGQAAVTASQNGHRDTLAAIERDINGYVRTLYGIPKEATLWVIR